MEIISFKLPNSVIFGFFCAVSLFVLLKFALFSENKYIFLFAYHYTIIDARFFTALNKGRVAKVNWKLETNWLDTKIYILKYKINFGKFWDNENQSIEHWTFAFNICFNMFTNGV